jgi:hypothetical protein
MMERASNLGFSVSLQAAAKTSLTGGRDKFTVFAQAVTTTPETEAEADTTEETTVPETTEDAPAPALKTKKFTKRVKHIMEVSSLPHLT